MNNSILYIKKIYPEIYTITIKYSSIINQMLQMLQMLQLLQMLQMEAMEELVHSHQFLEH